MPRVHGNGMLPLLKGVSRSFYLSLRLLPGAVRSTLGLAYLLARASDTIADAATAPVEVRVAILRGLPETGASPLPRLGTLPPSEEALLRVLPELLRELDVCGDKEEILGVWRTILRGQIFDLERFAPGSAPLTFREAEEYTGMVAGCVGEFWTDVCYRRVPGYSGEEHGAMRALGFEFGCGLQWVNILRDRAADKENGRVYLEEQNFWEALRLAREKLGSGLRYAGLVRPRRLRAACRLPAELGLRTLELVADNPRARRVRVGRGAVWLLLLRSLWH